jgi:hypothetical protein
VSFRAFFTQNYTFLHNSSENNRNAAISPFRHDYTTVVVYVYFALFSLTSFYKHDQVMNVIFHCLGGSWEKCGGGGGGRCKRMHRGSLIKVAYACVQGGEGPFFAYVLNGRPCVRME